MCIIFNLRMSAEMKTEIRETRARKEGAWLPTADMLEEHMTLPDGISGGQVFVTEWVPSTKHSLLSDAQTHTPPHSMHTHSEHKVKSQPPLSPLVLLVNISIMKCIVT